MLDAAVEGPSVLKSPVDDIIERDGATVVMASLVDGLPPGPLVTDSVVFENDANVDGVPVLDPESMDVIIFLLSVIK